MAQTAETQEQQKSEYWLTSDHVDAMKSAIVRESQNFVKGRNETRIQLMYDSGLRVSETVALDVRMLRLDDEEQHIALP